MHVKVFVISYIYVFHDLIVVHYFPKIVVRIPDSEPIQRHLAIWMRLLIQIQDLLLEFQACRLRLDLQLPYCLAAEYLVVFAVIFKHDYRYADGVLPIELIRAKNDFDLTMVRQRLICQGLIEFLHALAVGLSFEVKLTHRDTDSLCYHVFKLSDCACPGQRYFDVERLALWVCIGVIDAECDS